jgi:hypothetical protein
MIPWNEFFIGLAQFMVILLGICIFFVVLIILILFALKSIDR